MATIETPKTTEVSTAILLWAPKKKNKEGRQETKKYPLKKKLKFDSPTSPIKNYTKGWTETRTSLAECKCYLKTEPCHSRPCRCKKPPKFNDEYLYEKKKIILKCTCPRKCEILQSGQEMF